MPNLGTIIPDFRTEKSQSLYVQPMMDVTKATAFVNSVNPATGAQIGVNDVLVLFDERDGKGLALTQSHLVVNAGVVGMFSLDSLESVGVAPYLFIHRRLTVRLAGNHTFSVVLTRGNRGADTVAAILQRCAGAA